MSAQGTPKEHRGCALCWALGSSSEQDKLTPCPGYVVAPPEEANVRFQVVTTNRVAEGKSQRAALRR